MAVSKHGRGAEQVSLRLPDGLRERIKLEADRQGRSMNAEIVHALEVKYPPNSIDIRDFAWFLGLIAMGKGQKGNVTLHSEVNNILSKAERPYRLEVDNEGTVKFHPLERKEDDGREDEDDNRPPRED